MRDNQIIQSQNVSHVLAVCRCWHRQIRTSLLSFNPKKIRRNTVQDLHLTSSRWILEHHPKPLPSVMCMFYHKQNTTERIERAFGLDTLCIMRPARISHGCFFLVLYVSLSLFLFQLIPITDKDDLLFSFRLTDSFGLLVIGSINTLSLFISIEERVCMRQKNAN